MTSQTLTPPDLNTLRIEIDGEIGTLTLNRPDAFNAMSPEMIGELTVAFAWLADRAPLRGLIVTGAGRAFCAGGDLTWFQKGLDSDEFDLPSDVRRGERSGGRSRVLAGARLRHQNRLRGRFLRLRLRAHRRLPRRGHDLLPTARGRAREGA
jgi:enoyl-CoA hydratase/carnithine racemase